ncbi:6101_t:CDS:2 [Acaulospora morrowiae]|uniref:Mitochondrial import inner membrane translocase subunit TIM54 n=1 Tax=Acaulospora morrowiae TaxID=94023 RepID=A0A9N8Z9D7_9GLOM|nr:6101_t:CDS:2 [Acaulospora morrowiae]
MSIKIFSSLKLPSKKVLLFFGSCAGLAGLFYRDHILSEQAKRRVEEKVAHIALEPLSVSELPRKVTVYLAPPPGDGIHKTRVHFREYVKPVLVASALDYELVEGIQPGQLRSKVCEIIRERRLKSTKNNLTQYNDNKSSGAIMHDPQLPTPSSESDGAIIIGRLSWVEYLQGLNDGCSASLVDPQPDSPTTVSKNEIDPENQTVSMEKPIPNLSTKSQTLVKGEDEFSVPKLEPIGYVHFYNRIGWMYIPLRIYHAFNSYMNYDIASKEVVKVALGNNVRKFMKDDLKLGEDEEKFFKGNHLEEPELDERIAERLTMYT